MNISDLLKQAEAAPSKPSIEAARDTVLLLRQKGYTWRKIASFLGERGISTDHTRLYRLINTTKTKKTSVNISITIPPSGAYEKALSTISLSDKQKMMLRAHYEALNRSITYTELATSAGYADYGAANLQYGLLGFNLGEAIGFEFADSESRPGEKFYSSSIGMPNAYKSGEFQLVMHHELAKAIQALGWFA